MRYVLEKYKQHHAEIGRITRFLLTGGWNTVFGVGIYALLYACLHKYVHYLVLLIPANILAITNAYVGYKLFVFRTRGNIWREYLRCYVVYGGAMLLGALIMFILVDGFGWNPVVSQVVCVAVTTVCSYFSHRNYSFGKRGAIKSPGQAGDPTQQ
jgi:putative flippase GtrA